MSCVSAFKGAKVLPKPVIAELPDTYKLSEEELKFYREKGYLVIRGLIDFGSIYAFKQRFLHICNGLVRPGNMNIVKEPTLRKTGAKAEDYINKIQEIVFDDVFSKYAEHPRMLHVLTQLIGEDITAINSMIINKPPGTVRHPPHQDLFYFPLRPASKIVGAWTAIDHVSADNGCLYVVPGTHLAESLYPHGDAVENLKLYHCIQNETLLAPEEQRVHFEMDPGDTIFFSPYLIHGSGANNSKNFRKAITFHFANNQCYYIDLKGTLQENMAHDVEREIGLKRGVDTTYENIFRVKSKLIRGFKSNL